MGSLSTAKQSTWVLSSIPSSTPLESNFQLQSSDLPTINPNEVLVKNHFISVDPYHRGLIRSMTIGQSIQAGQVGEVIESQSKKYGVGDMLLYYGNQSTHNVIKVKEDEESSVLFHTVKVPALPEHVSSSVLLGALGMPGMTAYFGIKNILKIQQGEVVVVSAAAGAVGSMVGQIARHLYGAGRVIGTAGGKEKCEYAKRQYGFDAVIDYKEFDTKEKIQAEFKRLAPNGIDCYFDNVGGYITNSLWGIFNKNARVAVCGAISMYNTGPQKVDDFLHDLIYKQILVQGFMIAQYATYGPTGTINEFYKDIIPLIEQKKVKFDEHIQSGFDKLPSAFIQLFTGANVGKIVVKV